MATPSSIHIVSHITDKNYDDSVNSTNFDVNNSNVTTQIILSFILSSLAIAGVFCYSLVVIAVCRTRTLNSVTDYFTRTKISSDLTFEDTGQYVRTNNYYMFTLSLLQAWALYPFIPYRSSISISISL